MTTYHILLIEDDIEISEMLKNYLATEHYEITCAFDGRDACRIFDAARFDLVLLDLMIPKVNGMEVMQHIRKSSYVPIIIISAKDTESDKALGLTIARNLARQLGGDILLESTPYVRTVFTLRLPFCPGSADSPSGQDAPKRQLYEKEAP